MSRIDHTMFREYDIRGRESEQQLNSTTAGLIGRAFGTFLVRQGISNCVLGHDNRSTSQEMHDAIRDALMQCGIHVIDIGLVTTPMLYWAQIYFHRQNGVDTRGGVMVTASHNPTGWNGVKLSKTYSETILGDDLQRVYQLILADDFETGSGSYETRDIVDAYYSDLLSKVSLGRRLKVVVNTANGTAGAFCPSLLRKAGCDVVEYLTDLDPTYPHYTPNPAEVEMMEDTGRVVRENAADVGIAIDADGDRLGVTDESGTTIWPDRYMILLSRLVLSKHPSARIVFDVKCSNALPEDIQQHGGIPIMWKTGHGYIKQKLHEEGAVLAGEMSGHIFFSGEYYGFDDALFAALKLLEYVSHEDRPLSQLIAETPYYVSTPTYQVEVEDTDSRRADQYKYDLVEKLTEYLESQFGNQATIIKIQGARVSFPDGSWGLIRASSNLPGLVLRFEAKTQERLDELMQFFRKAIEQYPGVSKQWQTA